MSTDLERALRRALDATEDVIRGPGRDLAAGAMRGHRRRRVTRLGTAGVSVLAAAVALSALYVVARPDGTGPPPGATTPPPTGPPAAIRLDPDAARPIEQVWPRAIRTLPGRLPNGPDYSVVAEIGADTYIVQAQTGLERYGDVYSFQLGNGSALNELINADRTNPETTRVAPIGRAQVLDDRYVAVQTLEDPGLPSMVEVVSVVDGAPVARVDLPPGTEVNLMGWAGDHLVWTPMGGGVYSATDPDEAIPGSNGFHLTGQGAWAVADESSPIRWWNVATGERHEAPAGASPMPCYGTWCVTSAGTAPRAGRLGIVGFDGPAGTAELVEADSNSLQPWGDHFCLLEYQTATGTARLLWDMSTNSYARIPPVDPADPAGNGMDIVVLSLTAQRKVVVNLKAIG